MRTRVSMLVACALRSAVRVAARVAGSSDASGGKDTDGRIGVTLEPNTRASMMRSISNRSVRFGSQYRCLRAVVRSVSASRARTSVAVTAAAPSTRPNVCGE